MSSEISRIIQDGKNDFMREYELDDAVEINGGHCRRFAVFLRDEFSLPETAEIIDAGDVHTWIQFDGKHYDAEYPHGLEDIHQHRLWLRITEKRLKFAIKSTDTLDIQKFDRLS